MTKSVDDRRLEAGKRLQSCPSQAKWHYALFSFILIVAGFDKRVRQDRGLAHPINRSGNMGEACQETSFRMKPHRRSIHTTNAIITGVGIYRWLPRSRSSPHDGMSLQRRKHHRVMTLGSQRGRDPYPRTGANQYGACNWVRTWTQG